MTAIILASISGFVVGFLTAYALIWWDGDRW